MVSVSVRPARAARHVDDGDIELSNGRTILFSEIAGNTWTRQRVSRLAAAVQARAQTVWARDRLPPDDPDLTITAAELNAIYGDRGTLDPSDATDGAGDIIWRSTKVSFTFDGNDLVPLLTMIP